MLPCKLCGIEYIKNISRSKDTKDTSLSEMNSETIEGSGIFAFIPPAIFSFYYADTDTYVYVHVCVLCSWNQTHLSTFGKETSSNTRMRWQKLHHQGTRPCCLLPGTWTVSPTARTGRAITRPTHRISMVCDFHSPAHFDKSFPAYAGLLFSVFT